MTSQAPPSYRPYRRISTTTSARPAPRYANIALGGWLFLSAFLWTHYEASFTNTWVVGVLVTAVALAALASPAVRWANAALGAWLVLSTLLVWPATTATVWNNVIVGIIVFMLAFIGSRGQRMSPRAV
jgi:hypothetical protein